MTQSSQALALASTVLMINSIIGANIFGLPSVLAARVGSLSALALLNWLFVRR